MNSKQSSPGHWPAQPKANGNRRGQGTKHRARNAHAQVEACAGLTRAIVPQHTTVHYESDESARECAVYGVDGVAWGTITGNSMERTWELQEGDRV